MPEYKNENGLMLPLVSWLRATGRLRRDTLLVSELRWFGRKVDLATLTRSGRATAYELKLNGTKRAIMQAAYNRLAFDRTFVVTATFPTTQNLVMAAQADVGIIYINGSNPRIILGSSIYLIEPRLRRRLVKNIREAGHV